MESEDDRSGLTAAVQRAQPDSNWRALRA